MNKRVLITGANRGIGLALCREYLSRKFEVIAVCRNVSNDIKSLPVEIIAEIDVSNPLDIDNLASQLNGKNIDIVICNAGILMPMTFKNLNFEETLEQFKVNALAPLRVVKALYSNLPRSGKIALISSRMGSITDNSSGGNYGYRMSKCALNAAGKSLAVDLKADDIHVAVLHPGYVSTEMVQWGGEIQPELAASRLAQRIEELNASNSGSFWHANGEKLPW